MRFRISVVGSGRVATAIALRLSERYPFDVVLYDPVRGQPDARVSDLEASGAIRGASLNVRLSPEPGGTAGSDLIVLAPEPSADPGKTLRVFFRAVHAVAAYSKDPFFVVVNDGVRPLCHLAQFLGEVAPERVIGTGTLPDSGRLSVLIAREIGVGPERVEALAIGRPGASALPLIRLATAAGVPVSELIPVARANALLDGFREPASGCGVDPVSEGGCGQVAAVERIVAAVGLGLVDVVPCSTWLEGQYELSEVFLSVPAVIGAGGVERVIELDLTLDEMVPLRTAATLMREQVSALRNEVSAGLLN